MPRYKVLLVRTVVEYAVVYVDADSAEAAKEEVSAIDSEGRLNWKFADSEPLSFVDVQEVDDAQ